MVNNANVEGKAVTVDWVIPGHELSEMIMK